MTSDFINLVPVAFFAVVFGYFFSQPPRAVAFLSARVQRSHGLVLSFVFDFTIFILAGFLLFWLVLSALTFLHGTVLCAQ